MMKLFKKPILCVALGVLFLASCDDDSKNESARFVVRLTDAPADYEAVNVDIREVKVHTSESAGESDGGWITLPNIQAGVYNLLELTNGIDTLLAEGELPSGTISQIRLVLGDNNSVVVDGEEIAIKTPSAQQSGLKLNVHAELLAGITYTVLLDFDAARSIVPKGNNKDFNLKPVIRSIVEATSGAIEGTVLPENTGAVVYAIQGIDTLATTYSDEKGYFLLRGLEEGTYSLSYETRTDHLYREDVAVLIGKVTDAGTVELEN